MNLITIIPIARGISKEHLTYFSSETPEIGNLVEAPLRGKKILGLVTKVETVAEKKSLIKTLPYGMKKLEHIKSHSFLLPLFVEACSVIGDYYASTTGAVLSVFLPKNILESAVEIAGLHSHSSPTERTYQHEGSEVLVLQSGDEERFSSYKSFIREEFAKKTSVFMVLPNIEEIQLARQTLEKGIEQYTYVLHNDLSKKVLLETWKKIIQTNHPVLILGTGYFLSVPRYDVRSVIIEAESSRGYSIPKRPFIDIRTAVEIMSKKMGFKVILGDTSLRVETIWREKENQISELERMKLRVLTPAECTLVDTRRAKDQIKKEFEMISLELSHLIEKSKRTNDRLFLFCSRKGLSPLTVCADCGHTVSCEHCGAPVVLYGRSASKNTTTNYFLCQKCGQKQPVDVLCVRCKSWKLTPLGVGIESVEKELKRKFPDSTVFILDADHVKTHKQAESVAKKFFESPGSVCVGTELALPYITKRDEGKIENAAIVSVDSYFSIPDFRIHEKIMNIIISLRTLASKHVLVQTRRPDEKIFEYALKGNLADFYRDEIEERKRFGYPPYNVFIKLTLQGRKTEVRTMMEQTKLNFKPYGLSIFEAFHPGTADEYTVHGLIMLPKTKWSYDVSQGKIDLILLQKLRELSPQFTIKIDPDSLL